jgi:hypothetical protein
MCFNYDPDMFQKCFIHVFERTARSMFHNFLGKIEKDVWEHWRGAADETRDSRGSRLPPTNIT